MDTMAIVGAMLAMQAANTQTQVTTSIMKSNADAAKSEVQTLLGPLRLLPQGELALGLHPRIKSVCARVGGASWGELTKDEHEGENVDPVLLDETLLGWGCDDLTLRRKRWR